MSKSMSVGLGVTVLAVTAYSAFLVGRNSNTLDPAPADSERHHQLSTAYYPVEDLVTRWKGAGASGQPDFDSLVTLVTSVVSPDTWDNEHVAAPMTANRILAVTHTEKVHQEIATLLAKCREPIGYYRECVNQDVCMHCKNRPMPAQGSKCTNCGALRCVPRFESPQIAMLGEAG